VHGSTITILLITVLHCFIKNLVFRGAFAPEPNFIRDQGPQATVESTVANNLNHLISIVRLRFIQMHVLQHS
jgi:hypothetical protein